MQNHIITIELIFAGIGSLTTLCGITWGVWRYGRRAFKSMHRFWTLHKHLGDCPIDKLCDVILENQTAIGELQIRQAITEQSLELGIYVCDTEGKCTWANDWLCSSFGIDSRAMQNWGWLSAIQKSQRNRVHDAWTDAVEQGLPYKESYNVEPENGKTWIATTEAFPVVVNYKITCYVGYVAEIKD